MNLTRLGDSAASDLFIKLHIDSLPSPLAVNTHRYSNLNFQQKGTLKYPQERKKKNNKEKEEKISDCFGSLSGVSLDRVNKNHLQGQKAQARKHKRER